VILTSSKLSTHNPEPARRASSLAVLKKKTKGIDGVVLSSVVPSKTSFWRRFILDITDQRPLLVTRKLALGFLLDYRCSRNIGSDRIADMAAASWLFKPPVIVIGMGTALTFELLDGNRQYIGGAIAPGPGMFAEYLSGKTSLLPYINATKCRKPPRIGTDTMSSIKIGIHAGYTGMINGVLKYLIDKNRFKPSTICVTGGHSSLAQHLPFPCVIDKNLTLKGLWRIFSLMQR